MTEEEIIDALPSITVARLFYTYGRLDDLLNAGFETANDGFYEMFWELLDTIPDFISYDCTCAGALSRRLCRNLFKNLSVAWTIRSKEDMEHLKKQFDLFIFEGFCP